MATQHLMISHTKTTSRALNVNISRLPLPKTTCSNSKNGTWSRATRSPES